MLDWLKSWGTHPVEQDGENYEGDGSGTCSICNAACFDPDVDGHGIELNGKPICINCDLEGRGIE